MPSLIALLNSLNPEPRYAQLAAGGNWEEAVRMNLADGTISGTAPAADSTIAGEVFYDLDSGRKLFFGLRYDESLQSVNGPNDFLTKLMDLFTQFSKLPFTQTLTLLGQELHNDPQIYLHSQPAFAEAGVIDYWKSCGSKVLRTTGQPPLTGSQLVKLMQDYPLLLQNTRNHIAVELAFDTPQYWFGVQVSTLSHGTYTTNVEQLAELVNVF